MGNSASVTPKGTALAAPRPDIDVEICPPGTMAAMEAILDRYVTLANWNPEEESQVIACRAILTAHRAQLDSGPTIKQSLTVQSTCKPSLQVDYTSETEDLSTWPQTRGPEWRRMVYGESLANGDAVNIGGPDAPWQWVDGLAGLVVVSLEVWTRRPAPEAQPLRKEIGLCKWRLIG